MTAIHNYSLTKSQNSQFCRAQQDSILLEHFKIIIGLNNFVYRGLSRFDISCSCRGRMRSGSGHQNHWHAPWTN